MPTGIVFGASRKAPDMPVAFVITDPSKERRDMILDTGMTDGMGASDARPEREVLSAA